MIWNKRAGGGKLVGKLKIHFPQLFDFFMLLSLEVTVCNQNTEHQKEGKLIYYYVGCRIITRCKAKNTVIYNSFLLNRRFLSVNTKHD